MQKVLNKWFIIVVFLFVGIFLLPVFSMSSSSAQASNYRGDFISISYDVYKDGKVSWALEFGLNTEERGLKEDEKANYRLNMQLALQKIFNDKKSEILTFYSQNQQEEFNPTENITHTDVLYDQKTDSAGFKIIYKNIDVYKFYNFNETDKEMYVDNIFLTNKSVKRIFPFALNIGENNQTSYADYYRNHYVSACKGLTIEEKMKIFKPQFIYDYAINTNKLKSNADINYVDAAGKYHHAWAETYLDNDDPIIMSMSLTSIKKAWWYVLGISVPLIIMGIAIATIKIKENKLKKSQQETAD